MRPPPRKPPIPRQAQETIRQALIALLDGEPLSAREISMTLHIPEKEVYGHLEHIRRTLGASGGILEIIPAQCRACDFIFGKRERLTPPGRCPICRHESIMEPLFAIRHRLTAE